MDNFDTLRREATKLERVLEEKGVKYQQLAHRLTTGSDNDKFNENNSHNPLQLHESAETGSLINNRIKSSTTDEQQESSLAADINRTISLMSDLINTKMAPIAESTGNAQHALLVKRYREILFDCSADFKKTSAAVSRRREAAELFLGAKPCRNSDDNNGRDPAMEQLLRERNAIGNSIKSATSVLGQASEIHSDLRNQGQSLRNVSGKMARIVSNVPGLNHLIEAIHRKRNRDDMIVSMVTACCILFTLWYIFVA